jgi:UDP-N-acetylmuramate: L-alanyl-gamma-D-glutamyl-meso-diaminopimelate ligase
MESSVKKVFFIGIGGVAMGNAAMLAKKNGWQVLGSDCALYAPMDKFLRLSAIDYYECFDEKNIAAFAPDLVVVGNCVARGNCEVEWLIDGRKFPFVSLPQFLFDFFLKDRHRIVFSGTHGKTTSAAACAYYLRNIGVDAGYFVGGSPLDFQNGAAVGDPSAPFAMEGDEYDSAFFDKRSKFVHYAPDTAVIGAIEFDHGDIFRDLADVERAFSHMLRTVPRSGKIFYCGDSPSARSVASVPWTRSYSVGIGKNNDFRIAGLEAAESGTQWRICHECGETAVRCGLFGEFNARNCTMAILAAHGAIGSPLPKFVDLQRFSGVRRRQQLLHRDGKCAVYEDFGHHPSAVREVLNSMRLRHGNCELIACFEPSSLTSMRAVFADEFLDAFSLADRCYWAAAPRKITLPAEDLIDVGRLVAELRGRGIDAAAFVDNGKLLERLLAVMAAESGKFRVAVLFSSGAFAAVLSHWKEVGNGGS